jgi:hypothetical protein
MKKKVEKIDPNVLIDVAVSAISDKPAKTLVGRILRWIKGVNKVRNEAGIKVK